MQQDTILKNTNPPIVKKIMLELSAENVFTQRPDRITEYRTIYNKTEGTDFLKVSVILFNTQYGKLCFGKLAVRIKVHNSDIVLEKEIIYEIWHNKFEEIKTAVFDIRQIYKSIDEIISSNKHITAINVTVHDIGNDYNILACGELKVVHQLEENYINNVSFENFELLRLSYGNYIDYSAQNSQSSFALDNLQGIHPTIILKNIHQQIWPYQVRMHLYDKDGNFMDEYIKTDIFSNDENGEFATILNSFGEYKSNYWNKGDYTIKAWLFNSQILNVNFSIGDIDIEHLYSVDEVKYKNILAGKKIVLADSLINSMEELNNMIGLDELKKQIVELANKAEFDKIRSNNGFNVKQTGLHSVFIGNPGTGKTTVAELLGKILKDLGLLTKGHVVFEERSTLLGQFYNSENEKTMKAIEKAKGGILFIDEAYNLYTKHDPKDPGIRVIETLLTALSDEKDRDWMLIMAGYPTQMTDMLNANPGLKSRIVNYFRFEDYSIDELMQIAYLFNKKNGYTLNSKADKALELTVKSALSLKDEKFGNGRFIINLIEQEVISKLAERVIKAIKTDNNLKNNKEFISTIQAEDIPYTKPLITSKSADKLNDMVGLGALKQKIGEHINYIKFLNARRENGIYTPIPPLHSIFTGNPGTGKTTVSDFLGEIYNSMGILSKGEVIKVTRADLIGECVGETERKVKDILQRAQGNILFIDEAYNLFVGNKNDNSDFGNRVLEALLVTLSKEEIDMIVIMAGYPKEMENMLNSNPGLKSRFPYTFHFEDYKPKELLDIAVNVANENNLEFSKEALKALSALINKEYKNKDCNFGNARFVTRLILTIIIPNMSSRLVKTSQLEPKGNIQKLRIIEAEDIPIAQKEVDLITTNSFDEEAILAALKKLDSLIGLKNVKKSIRNFIEVSRYLNLTGKPFVGTGPLKWSFTGNSGMGKSTVARIMGEILKAMHLIGKGHIVEIKGDDLYNLPDSKIDEIIKKEMRKSQQGILFIDSDSSLFRSTSGEKGVYSPNTFREYLRSNLAINTAEMPGVYSIIIAEQETIRQNLTKSLAKKGITAFDHNYIFEDYTQSELLQILEKMLKEKGYTFAKQSKEIMKNYICSLYTSSIIDYANARTMKLLARTIVKIAILREATKNENNSLAQKQGVILEEDVSSFIPENISQLTYSGYKTIGYKRIDIDKQ